MSKYGWLGAASESSNAGPIRKKEKIRSAVDTGDKLTEIKWCDHIHVSVDYLKTSVPTALITSPVTYLVVEEGKIKLLCGNCLRAALLHRKTIRLAH